MKSSVVTVIMLVYALLVSMPLWLVFCGGVLHTINAPAWLWVMYFAYMVASVVGVLIGAASQLLRDQSK